MSSLAVDLSRPLKAAIVDHIAADPGVLAFVPLDRIYAMSPPANPVWPFIRYGSPITGGFEATCWNGSTTRVTIHAFAETKTIYAGEDRALDIAAAIVNAMGSFAPDNLGVIECEWLQTRCIQEDGEADRWHSITEFDVTVIETV